MAKYMGYNSEGKGGGAEGIFNFLFLSPRLSLRAGRMRCSTLQRRHKKMQSLFFVEAERILFF